VCVCVYVCVCERERESERKRWSVFQMFAAIRVIISIKLKNPDIKSVRT